MSDANDIMTHDVPGALVNGWMNVEELAWLYERAQQMTSIVEIGSWKGRSTSALCAGCHGPVYAVDTWLGFGDAILDDPWSIFQHNMRTYQNCVPISALSRYAVNHPKIPESVDMVFIDGEHQYHDVLMDLQTWAPKATKLVCGHDRDHSGVRQAVQEYFTLEQQNLMVGPVSLWYVEVHR